MAPAGRRPDRGDRRTAHQRSRRATLARRRHQRYGDAARRQAGRPRRRDLVGAWSQRLAQGHPRRPGVHQSLRAVQLQAAARRYLPDLGGRPAARVRAAVLAVVSGPGRGGRHRRAARPGRRRHRPAPGERRGHRRPRHRRRRPRRRGVRHGLPCRRCRLGDRRRHQQRRDRRRTRSATSPRARIACSFGDDAAFVSWFFTRWARGAASLEAANDIRVRAGAGTVVVDETLVHRAQPVDISSSTQPDLNGWYRTRDAAFSLVHGRPGGGRRVQLAARQGGGHRRAEDGDREPGVGELQGPGGRHLVLPRPRPGSPGGLPRRAQVELESNGVPHDPHRHRAHRPPPRRRVRRRPGGATPVSSTG